MQEVGSEEENRICPKDFRSWFSRADVSSGVGAANEGRPGPRSASSARPVSPPPTGDVEEPSGASMWRDIVERHGDSMMRARKLLCLDCFKVDDLMEMFAEVAVMVSYGKNANITFCTYAGSSCGRRS